MESDSDESFKSGEISSEDACNHCGLPNHPELVREDNQFDYTFTKVLL